MEVILVVHAVSTLAMVGVIWFVQIVHYPVVGLVTAPRFAEYEQEHQRRTTWVVAPLMLLEAMTALVLVWSTQLSVASLIGLISLVLIWLSTFLIQVPCHTALSDHFDAAVHRRLVQSNWLRTVLWTLRGGLAVWMLGLA